MMVRIILSRLCARAASDTLAEHDDEHTDHDADRL
jgi:hypothetical protein